MSSRASSERDFSDDGDSTFDTPNNTNNDFIDIVTQNLNLNPVENKGPYSLEIMKNKHIETLRTIREYINKINTLLDNLDRDTNQYFDNVENTAR